MANWTFARPLSRRRGSGGASAQEVAVLAALIALGVGAIVGTGILVLIGVGADKAGRR